MLNETPSFRKSYTYAELCGNDEVRDYLLIANYFFFTSPDLRCLRTLRSLTKVKIGPEII